MSGAAAGAPAEPPVLAAPPRHAGRLPLWSLLKAQRENLVATWNEEAFDKTFLSRKVLRRWLFVLNDPADIKHVLLDNASNYVKSDLANRVLGPMLGKGLLLSEGELWRRQRRVMSPSFNHKRIRDFGAVMAAVAQATVARWEAEGEGARDIADEMMRATLDIVARAMFSTELGDEVRRVGDAVTRYQESLGRLSLPDMLGLPPWFPRPGQRQGYRALAELDAAIDALIDERADGEDRGDLLAMLLNARDAETGAAMDRRQVRDEAATIITAGHETTANALTWTFYLLAKHPWAEARLHAELDEVLDGRAPTFDDVAKLRYARMVIDEAMRLYPPAHTLERQAVADDEVGGRRIPAGSAVIVSPWVLHRHRKLWDRPEAFDPERFAPERAEGRPRYAYLPFGGGPRICIGAGFALTEAAILLAAIAQRFRLRLAANQPVEPVGLITLRPRHGLPMTVERR